MTAKEQQLLQKRILLALNQLSAKIRKDPTYYEHSVYFGAKEKAIHIIIEIS